ncbi:MAG: O-antigen ligase family protein [Patescibacteria group bacterium]
MPHEKTHAKSSATLGWGVFVILATAAICIVVGIPFAPITILAGVGIILFAYAYPYISFGIMVALIPLLGWYIHIPVENFPFGESFFGGSVDVLVGEVVAIAVCAAWGIRVVTLWLRRNDVNWKPWLPLALPMAGILATHLLSAASPFRPDILQVIKYTVRPVFWSYLLYVVLTANLIRSNRKLLAILGVVAATGVAAALMGFVSLWFPQSAGQIFPRAMPLPMFGISPLGDNHNLLAEWLNITTLSTIALIVLMKEKRIRRILIFAAIFQGVIALLTFARTIWIVAAFEAVLLAWETRRDLLVKRLPDIFLGALILLPIAGFMFFFASSSLVESSTSTRIMLTEIALNVWKDSPLIGSGAGTFVGRIASTALFTIEFGTPLDSHGWIQKLLAETGLAGLVAAAWFVWAFFRLCYSKLRTVFAAVTPERTAFLLLAVSALGGIMYQLFNTDYWSGKMWFPIGLALAASRALERRKSEREVTPESVNKSTYASLR